METNLENEKKFKAFIEDYISTYKNVEKFNGNIEENAKKFAITQLIYDRAKAKDYTFVHGNLMSAQTKKYDVILTSSFKYGVLEFCVILDGDLEAYNAYTVKINEKGTINDDIIKKYTFLL